ncbi:hypothetical protein L3Q67_26955 [Saccharothrix sp. AJ9571]|nr:hypothetical protein L3Q67_26955 [Saccharothrix sp. AJ9571]
MDPAYLIRLRIAVPARLSSDQKHPPGLQAHPDVLFALRLADEPAADESRVRE